MNIAYFPRQVSKAGKPVLDKFITHLSQHHIILENSYTADAAIIWSVLWRGAMSENWSVYQQYRSRNKPVIVIETGNLLRGRSYKFCLYNINAAGVHAVPTQLDVSRAKKFAAAFTPIKQASDILICTQQEQSLLWQNQPPITDWLHDVISQIRSVSDRRIIVRPHPRQRLNFTSKFKNVVLQAPIVDRSNDSTNFVAALKSAWCVVGHNSGSLIEAAAHHLPVFCHSSSLCRSISNGSLANIEYAKVKTNAEWLNYIAHTEWFEGEIAQGTPWKILQDYLPNTVI